MKPIGDYQSVLLTSFTQKQYVGEQLHQKEEIFFLSY